MVSTYTLIYTIQAFSSLISELYELERSRPVLFGDLEGYDLCRNGPLALITIYALPLAMTDIVDASALGEASFTTEGEHLPGRALTSLMEDKNHPE
ncbi:hypothetical protein FRC00_012401, partial [Tulasnella sp. 408]